jgi:hypothetical protein
LIERYLAQAGAVLDRNAELPLLELGEHASKHVVDEPARLDEGDRALLVIEIADGRPPVHGAGEIRERPFRETGEQLLVDRGRLERRNRGPRDRERGAEIRGDRVRELRPLPFAAAPRAVPTRGGFAAERASHGDRCGAAEPPREIVVERERVLPPDGRGMKQNADERLLDSKRNRARESRGGEGAHYRFVALGRCARRREIRVDVNGAVRLREPSDEAAVPRQGGQGAVIADAGRLQGREIAERARDDMERCARRAEPVREYRENGVGGLRPRGARPEPLEEGKDRIERERVRPDFVLEPPRLAGLFPHSGIFVGHGVPRRGSGRRSAPSGCFIIM